MPSVKLLGQSCQLGISGFVGEMSSGVTTTVFNLLLLGLAGNVAAVSYTHLLIQLFLRGQFTEQQQIGRLFKGKTAAGRSPDQVLDIIAAVKQLAVRRLFHAVHILKGADIGNIRQTRQHALAVFVAQARLDAKFPVDVYKRQTV